MHVIAAKAVCFKEAAGPEFKAYQTKVVANARAMGEALAVGGRRLVSGGPDTHLLLVDVGAIGLTGKSAEARCEAANLAVNKNTIPFDPKPPLTASGIRLGSPALTTRGLGEPEFREVGDIIVQALRAPEGDAAALAATRARVKTLCKKFPLYGGAH